MSLSLSLFFIFRLQFGAFNWGVLGYQSWHCFIFLCRLNLTTMKGAYQVNRLGGCRIQAPLQALLVGQNPDHSIVASFDVGKPVSVLEDNIMQLQDDIFDEIGVPATKVIVMEVVLLLWIPEHPCLLVLLSFSLPEFRDEVQEVVRPMLSAYYKGDVKFLKKYCIPEVIERCSAEQKAYASQNIVIDNKGTL